MHGVITTRHLLSKAPLIIQEFGLMTYCRCVYRTLMTRQQVTFLECAMMPGKGRLHKVRSAMARRTTAVQTVVQG